MVARRAPQEQERESGVVNAAARQTLSLRLWNLDWAKVLPWTFDEAVLEVGTFDDVLPFMAEHYPRIFGIEPERFHHEGMTPAKRRFFDEMDLFVFRVEGRAVGIIAGHPSDWSTYYVRTFALLPEFREKGWALDFGSRFQEVLRAAGCQRFEAECSPANTAMVRIFLRLGGVVSGTINSERFGQMLRFTTFLNEEAEAAFRRQYIFVPAFGRNPGPRKEERREP